jgi:hypothetical protein
MNNGHIYSGSDVTNINNFASVTVTKIFMKKAESVVIVALHIQNRDYSRYILSSFYVLRLADFRNPFTEVLAKFMS